MSVLKARGFIEALQDYLATIDSLGLTVTGSGVSGGNLTVGNVLNVYALDELSGSEIVCSLFEEGGTITRSRKPRQDRSIRFVCKGTHGQGAVNLCWDIIEELEKRKRFQTDVFSAWLARIDTLPTVIAADEAGTHLADFVATFIVTNRTA